MSGFKEEDGRHELHTDVTRSIITQPIRTRARKNVKKDLNPEHAAEGEKSS